jgi:DNA-binding IclR family transcriptional regulator
MPSETDVLQFCAAAFKSVWALELLLMLKQHEDVTWRAADLIKELRCSSGVVSEALDNLTAAGLVVEDDGGFRYAAADARLDEMVSAVRELYAAKPTAVVREIMTTPNMKLKLLSDAFRINK